MITAFQRSAFQNNAFQIGVEVAGSGGKWTPYAYGLWRARIAAEERERERKEREELETELAEASARELVVLAAPIMTDLSALAPKLAPAPVVDELEQFMKFMLELAREEESA